MIADFDDKIQLIKAKWNTPLCSAGRQAYMSIIWSYQSVIKLYCYYKFDAYTFINFADFRKIKRNMVLNKCVILSY
jgi:hypothetical protein